MTKIIGPQVADIQTANPTAKAAVARDVPSLEEAFYAWVAQHGYIWFEGDLALAAAIATHLGVDIDIDGLAIADEVLGVKQE